MKVTNYELSKKLAEIGFDAKSDFYYFNKGTLLDYCNNLDEIEYSKPITKSYDLETILEALPKIIHFDGTNFHYDYRNSEGVFFTEFTTKENAESLADTVARLLLLLHKKNLIKF